MADRDYERNQGSGRYLGNDADWARQVRQNWQRGPYRDYGWESRESALPEFRDPSVHRMPYEEEEEERQAMERRGRPGADFRRAYDYENARRLPMGEMPTERGYGSGYMREEWWNVPGPYRGAGPRGYQRSNERILEDVCDRLTHHGFIDARDVEVHVDNGEVTLSGTIDDRRAKRLAEDLTLDVMGVKDVHNQLRLRGQQPEGQPRSQQESQESGRGSA